MVLISPREAADAQALRDWGDFVHIRHIAEVGVPGYAMITPYENVSGGDPRFLHFYEMDTDDPEAAVPGDDAARHGPARQPAPPPGRNGRATPTLRIMYVNSFRRLGERTR